VRRCASFHQEDQVEGSEPVPWAATDGQKHQQEQRWRETIDMAGATTDVDTTVGWRYSTAAAGQGDRGLKLIDHVGSYLGGCWCRDQIDRGGPWLSRSRRGGRVAAREMIGIDLIERFVRTLDFSSFFSGVERIRSIMLR
jgi:hypothetical protein